MEEENLSKKRRSDDPTFEINSKNYFPDLTSNNENLDKTIKRPRLDNSSLSYNEDKSVSQSNSLPSMPFPKMQVRDNVMMSSDQTQLFNVKETSCIETQQSLTKSGNKNTSTPSGSNKSNNNSKHSVSLKFHVVKFPDDCESTLLSGKATVVSSLWLRHDSGNKLFCFWPTEDLLAKHCQKETNYSEFLSHVPVTSANNTTTNFTNNDLNKDKNEENSSNWPIFQVSGIRTFNELKLAELGLENYCTESEVQRLDFDYLTSQLKNHDNNDQQITNENLENSKDSNSKLKNDDVINGIYLSEVDIQSSEKTKNSTGKTEEEINSGKVEENMQGNGKNTVDAEEEDNDTTSFNCR